MTTETLEVENIYVEFGRRVLHERTRAGWTQQDLCGQVGLTRASIANIETGRQRVLLHQMLLFAEVFCVDPSDLIPVDLAPKSTGTRLREENFELRKRVVELENAVKAIVAHCADVI